MVRGVGARCVWINPTDVYPQMKKVTHRSQNDGTWAASVRPIRVVARALVARVPARALPYGRSPFSPGESRTSRRTRGREMTRRAAPRNR
jgi:hypothetical protein